MKPAQTPQEKPETPVRVEFRVQFSGGPKGRRQAQVTQPTASHDQDSPGTSSTSPAPGAVKGVSSSQAPKITRLLVLGHHFENLVRDGVVKDYAEIARLTGLSRARVTQIANLTLLAPEIQQAILGMPSTRNGQALPTERALRCLAAQPDWKLQRLL